jgi:hypothetical protein
MDDLDSLSAASLSFSDPFADASGADATDCFGSATAGGGGDAPPLFGIVVPGREVITSCEQIDDRKFVVDIDDPASVPDLSLFLLPVAMERFPAPQCAGAALYFTEDNENWQHIGSLSWDRPSDSFRTGWPDHPTVSKLRTVRLGISFEGDLTLREIETQTEAKSGADDRLEVARGVALDLFRFCESFSTTTSARVGGEEKLILPTDFLERWMKRFESKYARDPNFFFKGD